MKYRRSTSFPGKVQGQNSLHHGNVVDISGQGQNNLSHGPIDMNTLDDARDQFMQYQVSVMSRPLQPFSIFFPILSLQMTCVYDFAP